MYKILNLFSERLAGLVPFWMCFELDVKILEGVMRELSKSFCMKSVRVSPGGREPEEVFRVLRVSTVGSFSAGILFLDRIHLFSFF